MPNDQIVVWSTESVDTSANLLSEGIDASFTKAAHGNKKAQGDVAALLRDAETQLIFYGAVKMPAWLKFDENRMYNNPEASRKLISRSKALQALEKKGFNTVKYYKVSGDTGYSRLAERLGKKFDVVTAPSMHVVGTVASNAEFSKIKKQVQFACVHIPKVTKKYRLFLGLPSLCPVLGTTFSEYRTLTFREGLLVGSNEDATAHIENLFEEGLLNEGMGKGFNAWSEEKHVSVEDMTDDPNMKTFNKLSDTMNSMFGTDFCAVDVVQSGKKLIIKNVTASPSLQSDVVLTFVSKYFKDLVEDGRKFTADSIKKLTENLDEAALQNLGKLLKKALTA